MALDPVVNFGKVIVSTGYTSAATSIALSTGEGSKLPSMSGNSDKYLYTNGTTDSWRLSDLLADAYVDTSSYPYRIPFIHTSGGRLTHLADLYFDSGGGYADITGFTSLSVSATAGSVDSSDVILAAGDKIKLVCTTACDSPIENLSFTCFLEYKKGV